MCSKRGSLKDTSASPHLHSCSLFQMPFFFLFSLPTHIFLSICLQTFPSLHIRQSFYFFLVRLSEQISRASTATLPRIAFMDVCNDQPLSKTKKPPSHVFKKMGGISNPRLRSCTAWRSCEERLSGVVVLWGRAAARPTCPSRLEVGSGWAWLLRRLPPVRRIEVADGEAALPVVGITEDRALGGVLLNRKSSGNKEESGAQNRVCIVCPDEKGKRGPPELSLALLPGRKGCPTAGRRPRAPPGMDFATRQREASWIECKDGWVERGIAVTRPTIGWSGESKMVRNF